MKPILALLAVIFIAGCATEPGDENAAPTGPTKADVKAREDFAKTLPKPKDH
jgi:uncharacterized lipoprotein